MTVSPNAAMPRPRTIFLTAAVLLAAARAGVAADIGQNVPASQRIPADAVRHDQWDQLLQKYVDAEGLVDYRRWKASGADRRLLRAYLDHLSHAALAASTDRAVKLAFWINAYNAVTIEGILREYPTTSIRNHTAKLFGYNIWDDLKLPVDGALYSLNEMEHEVLRKMNEPRIHFAIVCASRGCPKLNNRAYVAERLDEQLAEGARAFFRDPSKFRYDVGRRQVSVSAILDWFAEDFGADLDEQLKRIAPWAPAEAQALLRSGRVEIDYLDYDWSINDQSPAARPGTQPQP